MVNTVRTQSQYYHSEKEEKKGSVTPQLAVVLFVILALILGASLFFYFEEFKPLAALTYIVLAVGVLSFLLTISACDFWKESIMLQHFASQMSVAAVGLSVAGVWLGPAGFYFGLIPILFYVLWYLLGDWSKTKTSGRTYFLLHALTCATAFALGYVWLRF
ncbi:MAG: hypothetical protein Q8P77_04095 [Candidatus Veblenbacteria bacterium]|nr:hypothetical protein [Candidatus Veblenbacteria bacterium]